MRKPIRQAASRPADRRDKLTPPLEKALERTSRRLDELDRKLKRPGPGQSGT